MPAITTGAFPSEPGREYRQEGRDKEWSLPADPAATAQKGETCADYGVTAFIELLQDIDGFDLTRLKEGPLT
jgi:hypothetical protein